MTSFEYKGRDSLGALTQGVMEAEDIRAVAIHLQKLGFTPTSILPLHKNLLFSKLETQLEAIRGVSQEELIVFTRQLATVLETGVQLTDGLTALHEQIGKKKFGYIVGMIKKDIEGGLSFSDAMGKHKEIFSPMIVNMVKAGEKGGILAEVLGNISDLLEHDLDTTNKIKSSSRYPSIVIATLVIAFVIMTTLVIPKFADFFGQFKVDLPLPTLILIWSNRFIAKYWYWMLGVIILAGFLFRKWSDTEKGRYKLDSFMLRVPIFGPLFSIIYLSRFSRMLASMLRCGIPILDALSITAETVQNKVFAKVTLGIRKEISKGKGLTESMKGEKIFPPISVSMVAVGEKAGTLEKMLNRVADYFDREADYTISNLTPLLEPLLLGVLAAFVLLFALGIYMPMWDLIKIYKAY